MVDRPEVVTLAKTMLTCEGTQRRQQIQRHRHRSILLQKPIKCTYIFNKRLFCNKTLKLVCDFYPRYFPILLLRFFLPQWQYSFGIQINLEHRKKPMKKPWEMWFVQSLILHIFKNYYYNSMKSNLHAFLLENKNTSQERLTIQNGDKYSFSLH